MHHLLRLSPVAIPSSGDSLDRNSLNAHLRNPTSGSLGLVSVQSSDTLGGFTSPGMGVGVGLRWMG